MPYKFETTKTKLPEGKDRRVKLTADDKEIIKAMYAIGNISTYKLAEEFKVSRRTIAFILDPEKKKANLERREERGGWNSLKKEWQFPSCNSESAKDCGNKLFKKIGYDSCKYRFEILDIEKQNKKLNNQKK